MVYILLGTGFEEIEALAPCDLMRRAGLEVALVGLNGDIISSSRGIGVVADCGLQDIDLEKMEMIVLPGGLGGVQSILACEPALKLIRRAYDSGKYVAAICAAPTILAKLGITDHHDVTCYPGMERQMGNAHMISAGTVSSGRVLTGRAAGSSLDFGLMLIEALKGREAADKVAAGVVYQR